MSRDNITTGTRRCSNHCGSCHAHFVSVAAFDLHRTGQYRRGPGRRCVAPETVPRLVALELPGTCGMYAKPVKGVTLWTTV